MAQIFRFKEHNKWFQIAEDFLESIINPSLNESSENDVQINSILKNLQSDLKFNVKLIFTFGTGIASMCPIVLNLIKNQNLKIDLTQESVALLTLTSVVILALEIEKDSEISKDDVKSLLTELKLRGIGNGIVKKMVSAFRSIGNLLQLLFRNTSRTIRSLIDMFAYTSILIPTMNAINSIISDYNWSMDTVIGNLSSLGVGLLTFLAKNGWDYLSKRLKKKTKINPELDDLVKNQDLDDDGLEDLFSADTKLIKEQ